MRLPCDLPVVQAPLAGGPWTPQLTAAVVDAGGYGFVAAGYLSADALRRAMAQTELLTDKPYGVNLFVPAQPGDPVEVDRYAKLLEPEAMRFGVSLGDPRWEDDGYRAKLDVVESARTHLVSFTFGCPTTEIVDRLHRVGSHVGVTVTSAAEAEAAVAVGTDVLIVQGTEAGGHQGSFLDLDPTIRPLRSLLVEIGQITELPLIATGGVMSGEDAAAALGAGATAVQIGTALLCTPEAGTSAPYRRALLDGSYPDTIVTRAFSGRYARGLANEFALRHDRQAPSAYPEVHHLTRPLRAAATEAGDASVPNLWAGTGWRRLTSESATSVVRRIAAGVNTPKH
ncbi:MAG: nitronate monooxygenase [Acidimicrobiales bacterium]